MVDSVKLPDRIKTSSLSTLSGLDGNDEDLSTRDIRTAETRLAELEKKLGKCPKNAVEERQRLESGILGLIEQLSQVRCLGDLKTDEDKYVPFTNSELQTVFEKVATTKKDLARCSGLVRLLNSDPLNGNFSSLGAIDFETPKEAPQNDIAPAATAPLCDPDHCRVPIGLPPIDPKYLYHSGPLKTGREEPKAGLTRTEVKRVMNRLKFGIQSLYDRETFFGLRRNTPEGRITLSFVIGPEGNVTSLSAETQMPADLTEKVLELVRNARFPAPLGGVDVSVKYPLDFKTEEIAVQF